MPLGMTVEVRLHSGAQQGVFADQLEQRWVRRPELHLALRHPGALSRRHQVLLSIERGPQGLPAMQLLLQIGAGQGVVLHTGDAGGKRFLRSQQGVIVE